MTVSEWADKYRILDRKVSPEPGPWHTSRVPYTKEPMDSFVDPSIEKIVLVWGTQSAKTSVIENCAAYAISEDPGPMMAVYPNDDLARFISENRFKPIFGSTENIKEKWNQRRSSKDEIQFEDMIFSFAGSNSPADLSSKPTRYLFMDETDKYPSSSSIEANPIKLATERTKNFHDKKIIMASTPTVKWKHIWQELERADILKRFYVPCPHCGHYQTLKFNIDGNKKGGIHWIGGSGADPNVVRETAWYSCEDCGGVIRDQDKMEMLDLGEWRNEKDIPDYLARSVAYHLNSIYSPWVTFGDVAHEFLTTHKDPENFQNFINSWLAEPWEDKAVSFKAEVVLERQDDHGFEEVPKDAVFLTMGVDVQKDHFFWVVRAWGTKLTSWLVAHGRSETWAEIETLINQTWTNPQGDQYIVWKCCIDAGYNADEVYDFCTFIPHALPTKGASHPMRTPYTRAKVEKDLNRWQGLTLYTHDSNYWKDFVSGRVRKENGEGAWMVYRATDENLPFLKEYANQICGEQKVRKKSSKGGSVEVWEKIGSHADNHYLDAEVNAALAAELSNVRWIRKDEPTEEQRHNESTQKKNSWLNGGGNPRDGKRW